MALDSTMDNVLSSGGEGSIKKGDSLDSTMSGVPSTPSLDGVNAINDRNKAPFDQPRSGGGIPVKFFEQVSGSPGSLESTLENENLVR